MEKNECQHAPICAIHYMATRANIAVCLNLIHELTSLFSPKVYNFCRFAQEGLPRKQAFVDISVFLWLRKQQPRFAKGQPKGYFQMQEPDRTAEVIVPMNEVWKKLNANMRQYVPLHGNMGQHCCLSKFDP